MLSAAEPDRSSNNALLLPARNGALARSWRLLVFYLRYVKYTTPHQHASERGGKIVCTETPLWMR